MYASEQREEIVHFIASPGIIEHVFFPGLSLSDSLLHDQARPNPNPSINPVDAEAASCIRQKMSRLRLYRLRALQNDSCQIGLAM